MFNGNSGLLNVSPGNSINLSIDNTQFFKELSKANALFADGSGMRLAAKKAHYEK